jgi:Phosphoesterase family
MEILDRGYRFYTRHNDAGNVANVEAFFERFQEQAPIKRNQPFELEFYGKGAGIRLGVTAMPRRKPPTTMAAERRERVSRAIADVREAGAVLESIVPSAATGGGGAPTVVMRAVNPDFHSPFDEQLYDWGLAPPVFPDPTPQPPGGGGGGTYHSAVRIELFLYGGTEPISTWELPDGIADRVRFVKYVPPQGYPSPDAPVRRTGWWRMVVTPVGPDPVEIYITAQTKLGDVPIRATPLNVRLTDHLFRVGLEALVPQAAVDWDTVYISIGPEIAEMIGVEPLIVSKDISPANSHAKLRSLNITSVSGEEVQSIIQTRFEERVKRYPLPSNIPIPRSNTQYWINYFFKRQVERLKLVQPDDVCLRIQAQFADASVSVWGFDMAELDGELGELIFVFSHRFDRLLPFSFLDIKFSALASAIKAIVLPIWRIFTEVSLDVNKQIEDAIIGGGGVDAPAQQILRYMRAFLERAVGLGSTVFEFRFQDKAWQIRNSADPFIPLPGDVVRPPLDGGIADGGVISIMARMRNDLGESVEEMVEVEPSRVPARQPARAAAAARNLPDGYLTAGPQLDRLDRHQSIVVVMMENRSYDHMLGDLRDARPGNKPDFPYDCPPSNASNAGAGGFRTVPIVHTRDINIGTQIPVSPRHYFGPVQFQIGDGTDAGSGTGDMQGFARDLYHRSDSPQLAMTVYGESELSVHYKLADEFVTCDRWFAAHPGPTFPNRFATIMGKIPELDNFENEDPRIGYLKHRTVFDALSAAGIEWRVFESDLSLIRMFDRYRLDDRHIVPIEDKTDGLEATLKGLGPIPRVMFIEPNFADIPPLTTAEDDHPPADLKHGQAFLSRVCDLLWDSGRFDEILLVITYDEHGGFYDHVPPPGTEKGEPGPYAPLIAGGPQYLGVRVPTFVVSPYVSSGRTDRTIFDHTSILKTILVHNRSRLSVDTMLSFGDRVNQMPDLSVLLDLETPRQTPVPFIRRAGGGSGNLDIRGAIGNVLENVTEVTSGIVTTVPFAATPRSAPIVSERSVPPGAGSGEPRDYHVTLTKMLRPRRLQ